MHMSCTMERHCSACLAIPPSCLRFRLFPDHDTTPSLYPQQCLLGYEADPQQQTCSMPSWSVSLPLRCASPRSAPMERHPLTASRWAGTRVRVSVRPAWHCVGGVGLSGLPPPHLASFIPIRSLPRCRAAPSAPSAPGQPPAQPRWITPPSVTITHPAPASDPERSL